MGGAEQPPESGAARRGSARRTARADAGDRPRAVSDLRLGALLQLEAAREGHAADWRDYVAGRLLMARGASPPFGLLAEPAPDDRDEAATIAARWGADPDLLWLVVHDARRHLVNR
jgi:hypothetical protein